MKEKKFYETPFTTVTQIVTEGVFAASVAPGTAIKDEQITIKAEDHGFGDTFGLENSTWE